NRGSTIALAYPRVAKTSESGLPRPARRVCADSDAAGGYTAPDGRNSAALSAEVVAADHGRGDAKPRHVLAAAALSHCELIVTYNGRHFPPDAVRPWGIEVQGPSTFLRGIYDLDAGLFVRKLHEQARAIGVTLDDLLQSLKKNTPGFVRYFCEEQS